MTCKRESDSKEKSGKNHEIADEMHMKFHMYMHSKNHERCKNIPRGLICCPCIACRAAPPGRCRRSRSERLQGFVPRRCRGLPTVCRWSQGAAAPEVVVGTDMSDIGSTTSNKRNQTTHRTTRKHGESEPI